jgi:hypothetical protein
MKEMLEFEFNFLCKNKNKIFPCFEKRKMKKIELVLYFYERTHDMCGFSLHAFHKTYISTLLFIKYRLSHKLIMERLKY